MKNHALFCIFLTLAVCYGKPSQVQQLKKLPIDTSSFKTLIEYDYLYVDKTKSIHSLIQAGQNYFLVRPRRFGRTLFLSTLKEIFSGHKELFKDCWIGGNSSKYDWPVHPVISLNFLMINDQSPDELEASLIRNIQDFAEEYDIYLDKNLSLEQATTELIKKLSSQDKVVLYYR
jgi:hypothetical protein